MGSSDFNPDELSSLTPEHRIRTIREAFETSWRAGDEPSIENYLEFVEESERSLLVFALVHAEANLLREQGEPPDPSRYLSRFSKYSELVEQALSDKQTDEALNGLIGNLSSAAQHISPAPEFVGGDSPSLLDQTQLAETVSEIDVPAESPQLIADRYHIQSQIGRGGFGQVWRARDLTLQRDVAVKVLRKDKDHGPDEVQRFVREAQRLAELKHPGVITVYDAAFDDDLGYIVTDLVEGETLSKRLKRGPIPIESAVEIVATLAEALHAVHLQDLVHRDVKPSNILLDPAGQPILVDFGLAVSELEQLAEAPNVTGTFAYMAPEQATGKSHTCDARSDLYSLGVVFYEMLTGRRPFLAKTPDEWRQQILDREPRPPRTINDQIDPELERICLKCLEKERSQRFTNCRDLAKALQDFYEPARPLETETESSAARSKPRNLIVIASLAICLFAGLGFWGRNLIPSSEPVKDDVPDHDPAPAGVFDREPVPILLPSPTDRVLRPVTTNFDQKERTFSVQSSDYCFFKLLESPNRRYLLRVKLQKSAFDGATGIVLGYKVDPEKEEDDAEFYSCHAILLVCFHTREGRPASRLERVQMNFKKVGEEFQKKGNYQVLSHAVELNESGGGTLEIRVNQQRVEMIRWNDKAIIPLVTDLPNASDPKWSCQGNIGLANLYGAIVYKDVEIVVE